MLRFRVGSFDSFPYPHAKGHDYTLLIKMHPFEQFKLLDELGTSYYLSLVRQAARKKQCESRPWISDE